MKKAFKIGAGITLFTGVLLTTLVARTPLASLQPSMPSNLQDTESFDGSITKGSVRGLGTVNGPVDLQWTLSPMRLLTGKLGGQVEFDWLQATGNGQIAISPSRTVHINETIASSPASLIETFLPFVRFGGELHLEIEQGIASQTLYGPFDGELTWKQATISISEKASLGDLTLVFSEQEGGTRALLSSKDGEIELNGTIDLLPSGEYELDITAKALPSASRMVQNTLAQVAAQQSDGSYTLQQSGQIKDFL